MKTQIYLSSCNNDYYADVVLSVFPHSQSKERLPGQLSLSLK